MGNSAPEPSATSASTVTLHVPGSYRYLALVRETAIELAKEQGFSLFDAGQFEMAVDEACSNVIEHSYGGECSSQAEVDHPGLIIQFTRLKDGMVVEISDYGSGFDFHKDRLIDPEEYIVNQNERGLGLYIISQFVDDVRYVRGSDSVNTMRLTKRL